MSNKNPGAKHGKFPFKLLVIRVQYVPKTILTIAMTALDCLPELEGKTILLQTAHTSDTGLGGIELQLTWKASP